MKPALVAPSTPVETFAHRVAQAQAELTRGIERSGLVGDRYGQVLLGLAAALAVFPEHVRAVEAAAAGVGRQPLEPADLAKLRDAMTAGAAGYRYRIERAFKWRTLAIAAAAGVGLLLGGVVGGWAMFSQTEIQSCLTYGHVATDKAGRAYCWASFYLAPPGSGTTTATRLVNPP